MRILALNPYAADSHRSFVAGWRAHSEHELEILELPGRHWKWRMRHAAWTLAERARDLTADLVVATDMIDLAAWRGLAPAGLARRPHVLYMHESQLPYPDPRAGQRDLHFAFTNLLSGAAADAVWWNSDFHRISFERETRALLARMPDLAPTSALDRILARSRTEYPGHDVPAMPRPPRTGPPRILWAARWEPDKNPAAFFAAVRQLADHGVDFRLDVIGPSGQGEPAIFADARRDLAGRIDRWGYQASRADYLAALAAADIAVSTADHEFFGIAMVEAVAAGAWPLVPRRLAYPEVLAGIGDDIFYDGDLVDRLTSAVDRTARTGTAWPGDPSAGQRAMQRYAWPARARALDLAAAEDAAQVDLDRQ